MTLLICASPFKEHTSKNSAKIENTSFLKSRPVIFHPGQLIFLSLARMDQWPKTLNGKTALWSTCMCINKTQVYYEEAVFDMIVFFIKMTYVHHKLW